MPLGKKENGSIKDKQKGRTRLEKLLIFLVITLLVAFITVVAFYAVDKKIDNFEFRKQLIQKSAPKINIFKSKKLPIALWAPKIFESSKQTIATSAPKVKEYCLTKGCLHAASRIDSYIDYTVNPCDDFYKFACGRWMKENIIPDDETSLDMFGILQDKSTNRLKALLEEPIRPEEISSFKKVKTFYTSCVDKDTIEKIGDNLLKNLLVTKLGGWPLTHAQWNETSFDFLNTWFKLKKIEASNVFNFFISIDKKNSSKRTLTIDQPTLGLPSRNYYLVNRNDTNLMIYENLILAVGKLLGLADPATSEEHIREIVDFEIQLANISVSDESRRDPNSLYNPMTLEEVQGNYSEIFNWTELVYRIMSLPEIGVDITNTEIIMNYSPLYFQKLGPLLKKTSKRTIANYLMWRFVQYVVRIGAVGKKYDDLDLLKNYNKVFLGLSSQKARFRTCIQYITNGFKLIAGLMFVKDNFDPESKVMGLDMIAELKNSFNEFLEKSDWMDDKTKQNAEEKNKFILPKIGYPDEVHNDTYLDHYYFNITFNNETYLENMLNYNSYYFYTSFREIRLPNNKEAWYMAASLVNAYYNPELNEIVFPAAILQPPFYSKSFPMSLNFGGIGMIIGHEITHGFDDRGRTYDKFGNLVQWWSPEAEKKFKSKAQCLIDQYGNFTLEQIKVKLNGINTQGENIADNGGLKQSFRAYRNWVKSRGSEEKDLPGLVFTPNQLFFVNFAQIWCARVTDDYASVLVQRLAHSPKEFRVTGSVKNSKDFADAFDCPVGSKMNPTKKCSVW